MKIQRPNSFKSILIAALLFGSAILYCGYRMNRLTVKPENKELQRVDTTNFRKHLTNKLVFISVPNQTPTIQNCGDVPTKSFYLLRNTVSLAEFKIFINATGFRTAADSMQGSYVINNSDNMFFLKSVNWQCDERGVKREFGLDSFPVLHISWNDADAYCKWLSSVVGKKVRLPTQVEWEYAARTGNATCCTFKYSGSDSLDEIAWYGKNANLTVHPFGLKKPNCIGLQDMTGNVWQWCADDYIEEQRSGMPEKVCKGGCILSGYREETLKQCMITFTGKEIPNVSAFDFGFRILVEE